MNNKHCTNCGAPLTTEICPYCNVATGLDSNTANMEYPVIDCKEANLNFWNVIFPLIFTFSFGVVGVVVPVSIFFSNPEGNYIVFLFTAIFGTIGLVSFIITMTSIVRYMTVKAKGTEIEATVYGYLNDSVLINGQPAQIVKLLVSTDEGLRFILYQLGDTKKLYSINHKIKLKAYKNLFCVSKDEKHYF